MAAGVNALKGAACYVGGEWVEAADARVSPFDRAFLLGDSVFETLRTYGDHVFLPERHVDRLFQSARTARLDLPWTRTELVDLLREAWRRNKSHRAAWARDGLPGDGVLRLTVTRGAGAFGLLPPKGDPTLALLVQPLRAADPDVWRRGVDVHVATRRRASAAVLDPAAKVGSLLPLVLARLEAEDRGAHEAVLRNLSGRIVEGTTSNLFLVRNGALQTAPVDEGLLPGVTREVVLDAARRGGLEAKEAAVTDAHVAASDEAFLTSTTQEIVPVRRLGGKKYRAPGPVTVQAAALFREQVVRFVGGKRR